MASARKLRIATCQFAEGPNPRRNAATILRYIDRAAAHRADVVHFHEAALSGYGECLSRPNYDWDALREMSQAICERAARRRIWVLLGSAHRLTAPHKPHNSLYLIGPDGRIADRYDKRFLTADDMAFYSPGDHFVTFDLHGIRCGLLICFDLRFPELYRKLCKMGVRVLFQSFNNGHFDGPGIHEHIMRQTIQAHAGANAMWISAPNSSAWYSRWPSVFITPDGYIAGQLRRNRAGMMINTVEPGKSFYDPSGAFRKQAIAGALQNGRCVNDPRSRDRRSL